MNITNSCRKMKLPNGNVVDILSEIFEEMGNWLQDSSEKNEAGGYIVGYLHSETNNVTLERISHPYLFDDRKRYFFGIRDPRHKIFLAKNKKSHSFYMGVWHTHPQITPSPSSIDWNDWKDTLNVDETGFEYIFFIIVGIKDIRVWVGNFYTKEIKEIFECEKVGGLYQN